MKKLLFVTVLFALCACGGSDDGGGSSVTYDNWQDIPDNVWLDRGFDSRPGQPTGGTFYTAYLAEGNEFDFVWSNVDDTNFRDYVTSLGYSIPSNKTGPYIAFDAHLPDVMAGKADGRYYYYNKNGVDYIALIIHSTASFTWNGENIPPDYLMLAIAPR